MAETRAVQARRLLQYDGTNEDEMVTFLSLPGNAVPDGLVSKDENGVMLFNTGAMGVYTFAPGDYALLLENGMNFERVVTESEFNDQWAVV